MFENTYFTFFFRFQKHDFLIFFEMTYQKVVKKSKVPDVMGTYRRLSHTVLSCIVSCVRTLSKMFDVGDCDLPVLTFGIRIIKG